MKLFSPKGRPLSRAIAKNAALLNLLATPGLGSLLGRRWTAGAGQLILAVTGFTLIVVWCIKEIVPYYGLMFSDRPPDLPSLKMLAEGGIVFVGAWCWSAVTSFSLLREASAVDSLDKCGIYFGTTGGQVYVSFDSGNTWTAIVRDLPAVLSVEAQTLK